MIAVITGDVIKSRMKENRNKWLPLLKKTLAQYGEQPGQWEIFRGDSFQLYLPQPEEALRVAIHLKAVIKTLKEKDLRMSIGIGQMDYEADRVTECNGTAFEYSGESFELLKKTNRTLSVQTEDKEFNETLNLVLQLASVFMDKWTPASAEAIAMALQFRDLPQAELAKKLKRSQSSLSERQSRGNFEEVLALEQYFKEKTQKSFSKKR